MRSSSSPPGASPVTVGGTFGSSTRMSHLALMSNCRISWSRLTQLHITYEVTQVLFLQHTFSCSSGISLQTLQTHQDRYYSLLVLESEDSDPNLCFLLACFLQILRPWLSNRGRNLAFSSADSFVTKSGNIMRKIRALQVLLGKNVLGPRTMLPSCLHKLHLNWYLNIFACTFAMLVRVHI